VNKETFFIEGANKAKLFVRCYKGEQSNGQVVQILHGMAEYGDRYDAFAKFLCDGGFTVYVNDHRKHGYSITGSQKVGYYTDDTWENMIEDINLVQDEIINREGVDQVIMFGHSMGSFMLRNFLITYGQRVTKAIICGTANTDIKMTKVGHFLARMMRQFRNHKPSPFLDGLSVGQYNKPFEPAKTGVDWLSRDEKICSWYQDSPLCGYPYTPRFYEEITKALLFIIDQDNILKTPRIPLLFISGANEPVGNMGQGVTKVYDKYTDLGYNTSITLFDDARHEILNETNKEDVYERVLEFIDEA